MLQPHRARLGLIVAIAALACSSVGRALAEAPFRFEATPGKLPKAVRPLAYRIDLTPNLDRLVFAGQEEVDIEIGQPTDTIILNADGLDFTKVALKGGNGAEARVERDEKAETATFRFPYLLPAGAHTLSITYSGPILAQPAGIYYADYDTPQGRKRMLVTQFESTDARRMFPGWDEPAFKATYTLTVTLPARFTAISNTPVAAEEPIPGDRKKVMFATTPKMSSYLLVLVAGELDRVDQASGQKSEGVDIGVVTAKGKAEQGRFALDAATQLLPYYNDYFGVPYPLPKLDLIAIPGNFAAGAMENWGAITSIDDALLYDPATSTPATREYVYVVVAHEMAHQWSGDLVTMGWWDNLWLNEGFASWMENKATDHFNPSWKMWLLAHGDKEVAMDKDARRTTHPVQQKIDDESEAESAFDTITYKKGQSFIRMIESYLGEQPFRDGMRRYMKAHAYSNATTADLWSALEQASGKPVAKIAAGFTEQPGVPLVQVAAHCDKGETVAILTQDRFTIHDPSAAPLSWEIPVMLGRPGDNAPRTVLLGARPETVRLPGCVAPVKANFGDVGYYRTAYDPSTLSALITGYHSLAPADRANLLSDLYAMVQAGRADAGRYLDLTRQLTDETELVVWTEAVQSLREIDDLARGSDIRPALRTYARVVLRPALARLGWDDKPGEDVETPQLRALLIRALGRFDDPDVMAEARRRFAAYVKDPKSLPPSLQEPVFAVVGHAADKSTYDALHRLGKAATGTEERLRFYNALGGASDPSLIAETLGIALTDELPNGRVDRYLAAAAASTDAPERVWKLFVTARKPIEEKLTDQQRNDMIPTIAGASSDPTIADELKQLQESWQTAGARHGAEIAVETIAFKADYKTRLLPAVAGWLKASGKATQ